MDRNLHLNWCYFSSCLETAPSRSANQRESTDRAKQSTQNRRKSEEASGNGVAMGSSSGEWVTQAADTDPQGMVLTWINAMLVSTGSLQFFNQIIRKEFMLVDKDNKKTSLIKIREGLRAVIHAGPCGKVTWWAQPPQIHILTMLITFLAEHEG